VRSANGDQSKVMVCPLLWDPLGAVLAGAESMRVGELMGEALGDVADDHGVLLGWS
jgi:hypothetical protein